MTLPAGFGFLLTTETEHVELGTHHGRRLRGRVERRLLRVALGDRAALRLTVARARPVAVEVTAGGDPAAAAQRYELPIEAPADPWLRAARRLILLWALSLALSATLPAAATKKEHHATA